MVRIGRHGFAGALAFCLAFTLAGCSGLGVYNDIGELTAQGDAGDVVVEDVAYGPEARQKADVYVPAGHPAGAPIVVFFYGGKWSSGRKSDYAFVGEAFAERGYVAVVADYRLVPAVSYPAFLEDTAKAVAFAYRNARSYGGDPDRLFVAGHSAGAYNAAMIALAPEFLAAEGLSPSVVKAVALLSGPYNFLPLDNDITTAAFASAPDRRATQPIYRVDPAAPTPPLLLLSGADDAVVKPARHTAAMAAALAAGGKGFEQKTYPGIGHPGMVLSLGGMMQKRAPVLEDILAFFSRHGAGTQGDAATAGQPTSIPAVAG
ncbi:MAG: alpha/beta hydrolase [Rhizobiaceae bacterium]|nr:alpha/beta hydrolase [Rhizobiaceae bacterium]